MQKRFYEQLWGFRALTNYLRIEYFCLLNFIDFFFAMLRVKPRYARQELNCWVPYLYFLFYFRVLG